MSQLTLAHIELLIAHKDKVHTFNNLSATRQRIASTLVALKLLESPDDTNLWITEKGKAVLKTLEVFFDDDVKHGDYK